jgi:hypothetical protein
MRVRVLLAVGVLSATASVGVAQDCQGSRVGGYFRGMASGGGYTTGGVVSSAPVSPMYASGTVIGGPVYVNGSSAPTMTTERPRYFGGMFRRRAVYAPQPMPITPPVVTTTTNGTTTTPVPATTSGTATTTGTTTGTTTSPGTIVTSGTTIAPATTTSGVITSGYVVPANGTTTGMPAGYTYSRPFFRGRWMSYTTPANTYVSGTTYSTTPVTVSTTPGTVIDTGYVYPQYGSGMYFGGWRFGSRWR